MTALLRDAFDVISELEEASTSTEAALYGRSLDVTERILATGVYPEKSSTPGYRCERCRDRGVVGRPGRAVDPAFGPHVPPLPVGMYGFQGDPCPDCGGGS